MMLVLEPAGSVKRARTEAFFGRREDADRVMGNRSACLHPNYRLLGCMWDGPPLSRVGASRAPSWRSTWVASGGRGVPRGKFLGLETRSKSPSRVRLQHRS